MNISILLPSINRVDLLNNCLNSLFINTKNYNIQLVLITEDLNTKAFIETCEYKRDNFIIEPFYQLEKRGYMQSWNEGLLYAKYDIIFPIGDDGILTEGALDKVLEIHQTELSGSGLVGFNDGYINQDSLITHFITDKTFIKNNLGGVLLCPHYKYSFADNEVNERAKLSNKFKYHPTAYLYHEHCSHGKRKSDELDQIKPLFWKQDEEMFNQRKSNNFPNDYTPTI